MKKNKEAENTLPKRQTLDRLLSKLGIASRVTSRKWICAGRVSVNDKINCNPDIWLSWPIDKVSIDGQPISDSVKRFFLFHKPKGVVTTQRDELGRKTIFDLLPTDIGFIHAVGRLDQATSGLLLLTNDSMLSNFLTSPESMILRTYLVTIRGDFTDDELKIATNGIVEKGEHLKCHSVKIQKSSNRESHLEVVLTEGKNREIRRLFNALGHEVTRLRRIQYGPFLLGDLEAGKLREIPFEDAKRMIQKNNY